MSAMALINNEEEESHVLMVSFSAQGHLNPMLRLGKRLISHGLHVTLATNNLPPSSTASAAPDIDFIFYSDGLDGRKVDLDTFMASLSQHGPTNLTKLIHENYNTTPAPEANSSNNGRKKRRRLTCIVSNPFVPWAVDVANALRVPCALLWIQPVALFAVYYRFYRNLNPFPTLTEPGMTVTLPGLPPLRTEDLPSFVLPTNTFGAFPKLFSDMFGAMEKYTWVLANSFHALEKEVIMESTKDLLPLLPVGPLVDPTLLEKGEEGEEKEDGAINLWKVDRSCMEWLDEQGSSGTVVYVSFGSLAMLPVDQMVSLATSLKEGGRPFIWVVKRADRATDEDRNGELPRGFLEETVGQGIVVTWAPQTKVLAHPAVGCFVTHCGWSSTLEGIAAGVPMVAYPQWSDQPTNAKLVEDVFRVGARVRANRDGVIGSEEIGKCVWEVMEGPDSEEIKGNARRLKMAAKEAVAARGGEGSSEVSVRKFVEEMIAGRWSCCSSSTTGPC